MNAWDVLGLEPDSAQRAIKRAYALTQPGRRGGGPVAKLLLAFGFDMVFHLGDTALPSEQAA